MYVIRFLPPAAGLAEYVRFYAHREARVGDEGVLHPVPARAAPIIEFIFNDPFEIRSCDRPIVKTASSPAIVGLQTYRRVELLISGNFESFTIFFQPAALHRLFSTPMPDLTNHEFDARAVLGVSITRLEERLSECRSFGERAAVTDEFLLRRAVVSTDADGISAAAIEILRNCGGGRIAAFARRAGLSVRQFERRFHREVGVRPKLYARIARFEAALDVKARSSMKSWTDVAHDFGYYDQMHLVHDFEEFSGESPSTTLTHVERAHRATLEAARSSRVTAISRDSARLIL
jgi:AraC-like DNA-binding protein